jgi:cold shock CspA family protein
MVGTLPPEISPPVAGPAPSSHFSASRLKKSGSFPFSLLSKLTIYRIRSSLTSVSLGVSSDRRASVQSPALEIIGNRSQRPSLIRSPCCRIQSSLGCVSYAALARPCRRFMKDTMTDSSPSAETIRFVIEILSARTTPLTELPQTIANIAQAVARLGTAPDKSFTPSTPTSAAVRMPRRTLLAREQVQVQPQQKMPAARPVPAEPVSVAALPAARPVVVPVVIPARRRGRPRRIPLVQATAETPVPDVAPPQPRLLRRSDAQAFEAEHHADSQPAFRAPDGPLRGVVKWFDGRAGKGALRLTGISGDVLLDPTVLTTSGIKRLYKDQEVEATVEEAGGRVRLLSLSLPTRNGEPTLNIMAGEITGTVRRQPRSVQVEIKRDGIRQSAARAEAEQVLGGVGRIKSSRRLTP